MLRLRRLWDEHRHSPFPSNQTSDPRLQEVALHGSWLGGIVEAALSRDGLDRTHAEMLKVRLAEGNEAMFRVGGELGEPARGYVARLLLMEEIVASLPVRK